MCGIIHLKRFDGKLASKAVNRRYQSQKHRGSEGFGFVELNNGIVGAVVRAEGEKEILAKLKASTADEIMFHHRFPTSTPNYIEATHPILVKHKDLKYDYYVMHNGIVSNDEEMKAKHNLKGFEYRTEMISKMVTRGNKYITGSQWNDSEAMAIDFCLSLENDTEMESEGSIALVALQFQKKTRKAINLYYGHNTGNPVMIEDTKGLFSLSSETGIATPADPLFVYSYKTGEVTEQKMSIGRYITWAKSTTSNSVSNAQNGFRYGEYDNDRYDGYDSYGYDKNGYPRPLKAESIKELAEEKEFDMDLWEEKRDLIEERKRAEKSGDWDTATELQICIDDIDMELGIIADDRYTVEEINKPEDFRKVIGF